LLIASAEQGAPSAHDHVERALQDQRAHFTIELINRHQSPLPLRFAMSELPP
jgi:hypothetical protein